MRKKASAVIAVGACATTAGIPGMAAGNVEAGAAAVYGEAGAPEACGELVDPAPISAYIDVDFEVLCCPIDTFTFIDVLQRAIYGSNRLPQTATLCGECKHNDRGCFFGRGILCLGLVTRCGCGARCTSLGRPCNGCAGLSPDANVAAARAVCAESGVSVAAFDEALQMFQLREPSPFRRRARSRRKMRCSINVDHIARIEGHGNIHLAIEDGAVATCEMNVVEPARLFESMVRGRTFSEIPYIASRICGICSASHVVTDLFLAIERVSASR